MDGMGSKVYKSRSDITLSRSDGSSPRIAVVTQVYQVIVENRPVHPVDGRPDRVGPA